MYKAVSAEDGLVAASTIAVPIQAAMVFEEAALLKSKRVRRLIFVY